MNVISFLERSVWDAENNPRKNLKFFRVSIHSSTRSETKGCRGDILIPGVHFFGWDDEHLSLCLKAKWPDVEWDMFCFQPRPDLWMIQLYYDGLLDGILRVKNSWKRSRTGGILSSGEKISLLQARSKAA